MTPWPRISGIISDLDGVVYRGDAPIASAVRAFARWQSQGLPYAFVTNNSTRTAAEFADKLNVMGVATRPEQVITSATAAAAHASAVLPRAARVMVIGAPALHEALALRGFELAQSGVAAVIVGLDRAFTFEKLARAQAELLAGALFIGTNPDRMLPHGAGFEPGAGAILKAIETASGIAPRIIGKPQPTLLTMALNLLGTAADQTLMLGDQIETDIAAGRAAGVRTLLVKTGVPQTGNDAISPDFTVESLEDIPTLG